MKKLIAIVGLLIATAAVSAQTATAPQRVDWRFKFSWDDPNPAGMVIAWKICASNSPTKVYYSTNLATTVDYTALLNVLPVGVYALSVAPVLDDSTIGPWSTNHYGMWVGKVSPGGNLRSFR